MIIVNTKFDAGSIVVHDLSNPQNLPLVFVMILIHILLNGFISN